MEPAPLTAIVVVLISAGASFFFALAETALFSLSKWQVRQLAEHDPRGGKVARLLAEPQDLLAPMVLGNTFATLPMQRPCSGWSPGLRPIYAVIF
jgi:Mg2+/Co2+ transporter CorB